MRAHAHLHRATCGLARCVAPSVTCAVTESCVTRAHRSDASQDAAEGVEPTMSASVTLFTDRSSFETTWKPVLENLGVFVTIAPPEHLPERLDGSTALVVDATSSAYDEDELLAHLGLARAMGAMPAVMLPPDSPMTSVDELVDDICMGLVARTSDDVVRISSILARRVGARREPRFEYLTVSPRGGDLLAIL